jgi:predicted GNAT family acetyltransferase
LRELVGPGGAAVVVRDVVPVPPGWTERFRLPGFQMVCDHPVDGAPANPPFDVELLDATVVPEMMGLVKRTQPGPMLQRTIELGSYYGMRDDGVLVAMAGTRMRLPGYTEISAVCSDARVRGWGLAKILIGRLVDEILERGEVACLHVVTTNAPAIALYERLGFTTRREMDFALLSSSL